MKDRRNWLVEFLDQGVEKEFSELPLDIQARVRRIFEMIRTYGLTNVGMPYVRPLKDKLWEVRASGKDGIARGLYVTTVGRKVVILRFFMKKTQKTPDSEIKLALKRWREVNNG